MPGGHGLDADATPAVENAAPSLAKGRGRCGARVAGGGPGNPAPGGPLLQRPVVLAVAVLAVAVLAVPIPLRRGSSYSSRHSMVRLVCGWLP
ncbi:hypothetical protein GCM10019016_136880 [Streptomyces prasinosporus]|uniref:Uncharacterized protein n=1 Tax=Streptomyces prasinosporus TaxID=68256 RepID=A0ABP6UIJ4_9ACTN